MMLVFLPAEAYARLDERGSGICTVVDGESVAVSYLFGVQVQAAVGLGLASVGTTTNVNCQSATSAIAFIACFRHEMQIPDCIAHYANRKLK